jgi:hypothetical protein
MAPRARVLVASFLTALPLWGCGPELSAASVVLAQLPADPTRGPATSAVQTSEGWVFVQPSSGGFLRLAADGGAWEPVAGPAMTRFLPDLKEGLTLSPGAGATGLFRASGGTFVGFEPPVPVLALAPFASAGWAAVLGRDGQGTFWASTASFDGAEGRAHLARLEPSSPTEWKLDEFRLTSARQTLPASRPAMTSDGRFFFRPLESGVWELDRDTLALVERVPCSHELFRPSHSDYAPCQEDTLVFAGRQGELFILNPSFELWRLPAGGTSPVLVVKGERPGLERVTEAGFNRYSPGGPQVYVDPKGRVWLGFRWGENLASDTSYLYVAEPSRRDGWTLLRSDLPRNTSLFGDGTTPLLSSGSLDTGLLVFRVLE